MINNGSPASFFSSFFYSQWSLNSRREWGVHSRDITQVAFTASSASASDGDSESTLKTREAVSHL